MSKLSLRVLLIPQVFDIIFNKFLVLDCPQLMKVCRKFYKLLWANKEQQLNHLISAFDYQYSKCFKIQNPSIKYIRKLEDNQENSTEIALQLEFKVLSNLQTNKSYTISYSYEYLNYRKNKPNTFCWQIQFNLVKSKRQIWIYKEETRNHFAKNNISLIQDLLPVRPDDIMVIRVPYLTKFGFVELKSLKFYTLIKENIINRECEIEKHFEWILYKYFEHPIQFQIEDIIRLYPEHLEVVEIRCAGVDYFNFRIKLKAKKEGMLGEMLDHFISIKKQDKPIRAFLKKKGCYDEQSTHLQLRIGDELLIYHTPNS